MSGEAIAIGIKRNSIDYFAIAIGIKMRASAELFGLATFESVCNGGINFDSSFGRLIYDHCNLTFL